MLTVVKAISAVSLQCKGNLPCTVELNLAMRPHRAHQHACLVDDLHATRSNGVVPVSQAISHIDYLCPLPPAMAATADVSSVSGWSKVSEPKPRKPKLPGRYVHQSSSNYHRVSHSGSTDEDADSLIEALEQDRDGAVGEVEKTLNRRSSPVQKTLQ
eukprot:897691-Amphidinium_carterae.1